MQTVTAQCGLMKEVSHGVRFTKFIFTDKYDGTSSVRSLNIVTTDHELELTWSIDRSYRVVSNMDPSIRCVWEKIKLNQKFEENIFGNVVIHGAAGYLSIDTFDRNSLPFEKDLSTFNIHCKVHQQIVIRINIYRDDERITSMIKELGASLENKSMHDVVLMVKDEEISACKHIMSARSEVFASMFESEMIEKKTGLVEISDIELSTFKRLLNFIYTSKVDSNDTDELRGLIIAADKYAVSSLVSTCGYRLANKLTTDNAVDILILADLVRANFLKKDCISFILKNKDKIGDTEGYKNMIKSGRADLLSDIFLQAQLK